MHREQAAELRAAGTREAAELRAAGTREAAELRAAGTREAAELRAAGTREAADVGAGRRVNGSIPVTRACFCSSSKSTRSIEGRRVDVPTLLRERAFAPRAKARGPSEQGGVTQSVDYTHSRVERHASFALYLALIVAVLPGPIPTWTSSEIDAIVARSIERAEQPIDAIAIAAVNGRDPTASP